MNDLDIDDNPDPGYIAPRYITDGPEIADYEPVVPADPDTVDQGFEKNGKISGEIPYLEA